MRFLTALNMPIFISSFSLLAIGILVIYSSSPELALQQAIFGAFGIGFYIFLSSFDYKTVKGLTLYPYLLVLVLLLIVALLGFETRGSVRWIPLGLFNIQPSEFAKPALILFLAYFWSVHIPNWRNIFKSLLWVSPIALLIFRQPDLGSFLTVMAIWGGMLLASGISLKKIILLILVAVLVIPVGWFTLQEYQKQRIHSFLSPQSDPLGVGYNIIQSTIAVGSGEFIGRGLGRGTQSRLQFLPEFRTDFIFASIAEEMGFVGSMLIILIYLFLIVYCLKIAGNSANTFGFMIVFGVVSMLLFQTIVNIGMNVGILPITGITLPLISYGGSSLVATLICLGLVSSIDRFKKRIDADFPRD